MRWKRLDSINNFGKNVLTTSTYCISINLMNLPTIEKYLKWGDLTFKILFCLTMVWKPKQMLQQLNIWL